MSEEQELIVKLRRAYDAFSRGDFDAAIELVDPDIEAVTTAPTTLHGVDEFRGWMEPETLESRTMEPERFEVVGNRVLVRLFSRGRGVRSGISLETHYWAVWTFNEEGFATQMVAFRDVDEAEARKAAGLSE
jgi:ketosteroid isomerase-like protein